jgi:hypothetical protein
MGAGLGFKTFVTGDVLTAADTNGYLMQGVWVFANAAARDAAVTSPQEGNMCYLKDTDVTQSYSGSAWTAVGGGGMTVISTGTLSSTGVTFSSIAGTYNNLQLSLTGVNSGANRVYIRVNGDSGANYFGFYNRERNGTASLATYNTGGTGISEMQIDGLVTPDSGATNTYIITIPSYAATTGAKTLASSSYVFSSSFKVPSQNVFSYNGTAGAITSVTVAISGGTFSAGTYTLYGVK